MSAVAIASIVVGQRLRALDPTWVELLAEEIGRDGQRDPIRVVAHGDGYLLIDGARRLAALTKLGATMVVARVEPEEALADDAFVRLGEIKGNLLRAELTMLDRSLYVAAWRDLYLTAKALPKRGRPRRDEIRIRVGNISPGPGKPANDIADAFVLSLSQAARQALKIPQQTLSRYLRVASIGAELARRLVGHPSADNQRELLLLADQAPERQMAVVDLLTGDEPKAATVAEAIDLLDGRGPRPELTEVERVHQAFSRLSEREKFAVFEKFGNQIQDWWERQPPTPPRPRPRLVQ